MYFFCLVETAVGATPHLQWLPVSTIEDAREHARRALNQHLMPINAHVYADVERVDVVTAETSSEEDAFR